MDLHFSLLQTTQLAQDSLQAPGKGPVPPAPPATGLVHFIAQRRLAAFSQNHSCSAPTPSSAVSEVYGIWLEKLTERFLRSPLPAHEHFILSERLCLDPHAEYRVLIELGKNPLASFERLLKWTPSLEPLQALHSVFSYCQEMKICSLQENDCDPFHKALANMIAPYISSAVDVVLHNDPEGESLASLVAVLHLIFRTLSPNHSGTPLERHLQTALKKVSQESAEENKTLLAALSDSLPKAPYDLPSLLNDLLRNRARYER